MSSKLSKEQLEKLALHTMGINTILLDALMKPARPEVPDMPELPWEADVIGVDQDMVVVITGVDAIREMNRMRAEPPPPNLDALCGEWTGGKNKPCLRIFKAEPGYMAAVGKPDKKTGIEDCDLIRAVNGRLEFFGPDGRVYLYHDTKRDVLKVWPGGEYTRAAGSKK